MLHQMKLPQGVLLVQRLHGEFSQPVLQGFLLVPAGPGRQRFNHQVVAQVKRRVMNPCGTGGVFYRALDEAGVFEQPLFDAPAQVRMAQSGLDHPDAHNHHQVGR